MGGIVQGNVDGSIPPWTGGMDKKALHHDRVENPYDDDSRLYTINAQNLSQYKHLLSMGQQAMLEKYPQSYELPVYPSRRSASYPDFVYEALIANREHAQLVVDGGKSGVRSSWISSPFPEPENGLEAIWNHLMRWRGIQLNRETSWVSVTAGGLYRPILLQEELAFPYAAPFHGKDRDPATGSNQIREFLEATIAAKQRFVSPGRLSNQAALIYDSYDYILHQRMRWLYVPGLKRVIRLPRAQLDQPVLQKDGIVGLDDADMYRGSPELFDWELAGRQEMLIPYNAYALEDSSLSFKDIIQKHHLNQQHTRYERHRVWKVIATAKKESSRYSKRIFYLDEDTWQIVLSEKYDQTGGLVMYAEAHTVNFYDVPVVFTGVIAHYRLDDGRFVVTDINNMLLPYDWIDEINPRNFGPIALENYVR